MLMLVSGLEVTGFASNLSNNAEVSFDNIESEKPNIESEIISKRTAYSKVFSTDDGGYYSVVSATPIHIKDANGNYQNIEEPIVALSSEEAITDYISEVSSSHDNTTTQMSTYATGIGGNNIAGEDEVSLSVSCCTNTKGAIVENKLVVQGAGAGNKSIVVQPSFDGWDAKDNVLITEAKLFAKGKGEVAKSNNLVLARKIVKWQPNTDDGFQLDEYYFDATYVAKPSNSSMRYDCEWDVTNILNEWLLGGENKGFALTAYKNKSKCYVSFENFQLGYYYREINSINDLSSYETIDMGPAGIFYIDHFSRNIFIERKDMGIDGEKAPVSIRQTYSTLYPIDKSACGMNFYLNYYSVLDYSNSFYTFYSPQGDIVEFFRHSENDEGIIYVDDNNQYTLTLKSDLSGEFINQKFENINISTPEGEVYSFETHQNYGYLTRIEDSTTNKNAITISYYLEDEPGEDEEIGMFKTEWIQSITDGAGRVYLFEYAENAQGEKYISSITANTITETDEGNEYTPITVGSGDDCEPYMINYYYETSNNHILLSQIDRVGDRDDVQYNYDNQNRLIEVITQDKNLSLHYNNTTDNTAELYPSLSYEISLNKTDANGNKIVQSFYSATIRWPSVYQRIITNSENKQKTINFDNLYNVTYCKDYDGSVIFGTTKSGKEHYISCEGINNLITNSSFGNNGVASDEEWVCYFTETNMSKDGFLGIPGDLSAEGFVYQIIEPATGELFHAGESYAYGGKAETTNSLAVNDTHPFGIYIFTATENEDGDLIPDQCLSYFYFNEIISRTGQEKMSYFTLTQDVDKLLVVLRYDYNSADSMGYFGDIKFFEYNPNEDEQPVIEDPYIYEHNNNNSLLSVKVTSTLDSNKYIGLDYNYNDDCGENYLSSITDEKGVDTLYTYDHNNGRLISVAKGTAEKAMYFKYTAEGLLSSVEQTVTNTITGNIVEMKTDYGYSNGMISSVSHNGFSYNFAYDNYGNITNINICEEETPLVSTSYNNVHSGQIGKISYANGGYIKYTYGADKSISQIEYGYNTDNNEEICYKSISYSFEDNLHSITDNHAKTKILYDDSTFHYCLDDDNDGVYEVIYSAINDNGETVEEFNQFESATKIITTPSVTTTNDLLETTSSSSQTLTKEIPMRNDNGNIMTDNSGKIQTYISETYTYNRTSVYDEFMRPTSNAILAHYEIESENTFINSEERYTYRSNNDGKETTLIDSYRTIKSTGNNDNSSNDNNPVSYDAFIDLTYSYEYDPAGNISKIDLKDNVTNTESVYSIFKYDNANQLIFEYSASKNSCISYAYDAGGNITEKRVYDLSAYDMTNGTISSGAAYERYVYTYDDTYKDRLISVSNGESSNTTLIDYDDLGNPLNYDPADGFFTWNGHLLTSFENNGEGKRYEYEYDANEVRTRKIVYDKDLISGTSEYTYTKTGVLDYVWADGVLKGVSITNFEQHTNFFINIIYDESGNAQGYVGVTGTPYYFVRDPLGNITSIIAATDEVNIEVKYDAWGNPTFPQYNDDPLLGVVAAFVCSFNPSTYKGYIYDIETGLYCCGSRYYSSEWSRFINIDDGMLLNLAKGKTMATNLYTYCNNNPVNITADGAYLNTHWYLNNPSTFNTLDFDIANTSTVEFPFTYRIKNDYLK